MAKEKTKFSELKLELYGCPCTIAYGGLHGARPNTFIDATEDLIIVNYDVSSYYPSLMIQNHYLSRNVADASLFTRTFTTRLKAKKEHDKVTANALKLVLNIGF